MGVCVQVSALSRSCGGDLSVVVKVFVEDALQV